MSDAIQGAISELQAKLQGQEEEVAKTKRLINQLCQAAGRPPLYEDADAAVVSLGSMRGDEFYGQPLATCVRKVLQLRRGANLGPATTREIYEALVAGGYVFDTKKAEYAIRGIQISLAKNSVTFHKLPNGKFGLLEWYPNAKPPKASASNGSPDDAAESEAASTEEGEAEANA